MLYSKGGGIQMKKLRNIVIFVIVFLVSIGFSIISCKETKTNDNLALLALIGSSTARIYIFTGPTLDGNLGGRAGVDNICRNARTANYRFLNNKTVKGFLSVSPTDQIKDLVPIQYQDLPVYGVKTTDSLFSGTLLADAWTQLWDSTSLSATLEAATGADAAWWSGSNEDGTYNTANTNCAGWTSNNPANSTVNGAWTAVDIWVSAYVAIGCNQPHPVMCVAY
jgi:hypothetical protein